MLGFINIEGNCAPVTADEVVKIFSKVPLLSVWGDNSRGVPGPIGDERRNGCSATVNAIKSAGGSAKFLLLPEAGHKGSSHMLMMDKNNLQIADLIIGWMLLAELGIRLQLWELDIYDRADVVEALDVAVESDANAAIQETRKAVSRPSLESETGRHHHPRAIQ